MDKFTYNYKNIYYFVFMCDLLHIKMILNENITNDIVIKNLMLNMYH